MRISCVIEQTLSRGAGKRDAQFIMILDIDRVFSAEEIAAMHEQKAAQKLVDKQLAEAAA
jgi:chemotaxis signal transduction protein